MATSDGSPEDEALAEIFANLALEAGKAIMRVYETDPHRRLKGDSSPVCDADLFGEEIILKGLARLAPFPVVAEEQAARYETPVVAGGDFILVDALDGTKEFLLHHDSFTVNIALIRAGAPVAGVVYAPARRELYLAGRFARRCFASPGERPPPAEHWRRLGVRTMPRANAKALISRQHSDVESESFLHQLPVTQVVSSSSSLKFCQIAAAEADVYPRFSRTMEWDIAAGDAVLRRAGGVVADVSGAPVTYGHAAQNFANGPFIAWGDPIAAKLYARLRAGGAKR
ncbi:inositol monophosphatase family protein [uncultured Rhodoblastus sp.]|uniref:3'(2'),5'-bisphosphate nucleotidase CysQ family protein n=1 Tax=uncultured Rhodoblastus sp. TaxID=543037 RepID=UPI0025D87554|nr:inositol monophosphatase family protein [uncultured Rhodoblastus sp.]